MSSEKVAGMKTVYIHIGLGKTGTSFLQTAFAYNAERYLSRGLSYPDLNNDHSTAAAGGTTSGNGMPIAAHGLKQISHIKTVISPNELLDILDSDLDHLLSSEWLGGCQLSYLQDLQSTLSKKFYVQFVVVVRDPLEHVVAIYQEGLKSGTFSSSLEVKVEKILAGLKRN